MNLKTEITKLDWHLYYEVAWIRRFVSTRVKFLNELDKKILTLQNIKVITADTIQLLK
jgi:hypothetical protein